MDEAFAFRNSLSTMATLNTIPDGLGAAGSTRVSNELGAGNPRAAKLAVKAVMFLTVSQAVIVSSIFFAGRSAFGYIFYATNIAPLVCLTVILYGFQSVLSGIARGCGWQDLGAYFNLGTYYLLGIPVAAVLGFWLDLRGKGLWIGTLAGASLHTLLLSGITFCTNWEKKVHILHLTLLGLLSIRLACQDFFAKKKDRAEKKLWDL